VLRFARAGETVETVSLTLAILVAGLKPGVNERSITTPRKALTPAVSHGEGEDSRALLRASHG